MAYADCPSCDSNVNVGGHPRMGQKVVCQTCDASLEVVWLDPLELDWVYDEDEDYYDEEYDEDESDYEEMRY